MSNDSHDPIRRAAVESIVVLGVAGALLVPSGLILPGRAEKRAAGRGEKRHEPRREPGEDVSATEDLMREHGVLRRTLIVYAELAGRLRADESVQFDPAALAAAAKLFHDFGEEYHERILEEQHVFPQARALGAAQSKLVDVLLRQHQRGREITDYIHRIGKSGRIGSGDRQPLSRVLAGMNRMYEAHAAWEDTALFPAWKKTMSKERLDQIAEEFEEIEHQRFGKDGFDEALATVVRIEQALGLSDLGGYTAPPPESG